MLNDATGFSKIMIAAGYTDLRRGIEGLATIIRYKYKLDPYEKNVLFLHRTGTGCWEQRGTCESVFR